MNLFSSYNDSEFAVVVRMGISLVKFALSYQYCHKFSDISEYLSHYWI